MQLALVQKKTTWDTVLHVTSIFKGKQRPKTVRNLSFDYCQLIVNTFDLLLDLAD